MTSGNFLSVILVYLRLYRFWSVKLVLDWAIPKTQMNRRRRHLFGQLSSPTLLWQLELVYTSSSTANSKGPNLTTKGKTHPSSPLLDWYLHLFLEGLICYNNILSNVVLQMQGTHHQQGGWHVFLPGRTLQTYRTLPSQLLVRVSFQQRWGQADPGLPSQNPGGGKNWPGKSYQEVQGTRQGGLLCLQVLQWNFALGFVDRQFDLQQQNSQKVETQGDYWD